MRAVNLIPGDLAGPGAAAPREVQAAVYGVLGLLAVGVVLMIIYVSAGNSIADRQVQLATLRVQVQQTQSALGQLTSYVKFQQLARTRAQTVKQIADARYDWAAAFGQLARVVPANTTLQTVNASLSPTSPGTSSNALRSAISGPAVELTGCTHSQVDVARLMSRLRVMSGVQRVTLTSAQGSTPTGGSGASTGSSTAATTTAGATGCATGPTFDIIVFLSPPAGSTPAPTGTNTPASGTTPPTTTTTSTTSAAGSSTTPPTSTGATR